MTFGDRRSVRVLLRSLHLGVALLRAALVLLAAALRRGPFRREAWLGAAGKAIAAACHELGLVGRLEDEDPWRMSS